jgi:cytochrome c-type biogenesis protein
MEGTEHVSFIMAFIAGFLAFFSPCFLPLIPSYISYLTGMSFREFSDKTTQESKYRIKIITVTHSLSFILGFSIVFVLLGAGITFVGTFLYQYQPVLRRIGGLLIIFFGLAIMEIIKIPFLQKEKKLSYRKRGISIFSSVLVGSTFALAWTPCVGPILGSILVYASSTADMIKGLSLLALFSLGLGVPFLLSALLINSFLAYIEKIAKYMRWITLTAGIILIVFGVLLLTGGRI